MKRVRRKKKRSPRGTLEFWLDNKWKTIGKSDTTRCEICGVVNGSAQIHAHHIVSRTHKLTRWDLANRLWVCARDHTLDKKNGVEYNLGGWFFSTGTDTDWLGRNRPQDKEYLTKVMHKTKSWDIAELEVLKRNYRRALSNEALEIGLKKILDPSSLRLRLD